MRSKIAAKASGSTNPWPSYLAVAFILVTLLFVASRLVVGAVGLVQWMTAAPIAIQGHFAVPGDAGGGSAPTRTR